MKKFLVFLISIITVVSFGLVTYYFLRNDEVINFQTTEVYCNVGDIITVADLGKTVKKPSNKTTYNYNAAEESVVDAIKFDDAKGYYVANIGGNYEVVISTSNKKFAEFKFTVHIGDGSESNPYFIADEQDFGKIGNTYALNANYVLKADITLLNSFAPIGFNATTDSWDGFSGSLNGAGHTIIGSNYAFETSNAGLFHTLNNAKIENLKLVGFNISGAYANAGILAGQAANVTVKNIQVNNSSIINTQTDGLTGGLIGSVIGNSSAISMSAVNGITISAGDGETTVPVIMAGLVGKLDQGTIRASLATGTITTANGASKVAGLVGEMVITRSYGSIQQSYAVVTSESAAFAGFVHTITTTGDMTGINYLKVLIGNYAVNGTAQSVQVKPDIIKILVDESKGIYGVKGYTSLENMLLDHNTDNSYIFYAVEGSTTSWDAYIWKMMAGNLPVLINSNLTPSVVSSEYFLADTEKEYIKTVDDFMNFVNACRTANGKILNKKYTLVDDIDMSEVDWQQIDVANSTIDGKGHKISNLKLTNVNNDNLAMFGTVDNSTIKNIVFENPKFNADAKNAAILANIVTSNDSTSSSSIDTIIFDFATEIANKTTYIAGIANEVNKGTTIKACEVKNMVIGADASVSSVAGVANTINDNTSRVLGSNIIAALNGKYSVAGIANENNGLISSIQANENNGLIRKTQANVNISQTTDSTASIAGIVCVNGGEISNVNAVLNINVQKSADGAKVAGVACVNNGKISNVTLTGNGIVTNTNTSNELYVGGLVCDNNGALETSKCLVKKVGGCFEGKDHQVAGLAVNNSEFESNIKQCVVTSNIEGNTVAGAVCFMNNSEAKIDQIVIGSFNLTTNEVEQNRITGDKYVAGVVVDLRNGTVTNVQTGSEINGATNSTVSSLIVLLFPNGAKFQIASINSSFKGYGKFYSECWQDFRNTSDAVKKYFEYQTTGNSDRSFDILDYDKSAGSLQSVVINSSAAARYVSSYQTAIFYNDGIFFNAWQKPTYENTDNSSFFKLVGDEDFKKNSTYKGEFVMTAPNTYLFGLFKQDFTKKLTFDFDSVWAELPQHNGIVLQFLKIA